MGSRYSAASTLEAVVEASRGGGTDESEEGTARFVEGAEGAEG